MYWRTGTGGTGWYWYWSGTGTCVIVLAWYRMLPAACCLLPVIGG